MRIGIDLGGTKIEGVVLDDGGNELLRKRVPTLQAAGYRAILNTIASWLHNLKPMSAGAVRWVSARRVQFPR